MKETIRTNVSDCETSKTIDFKEHQTCPFYTADQRNGYNHQFLENDEETRIEKKGYNLIVDQPEKLGATHKYLLI